MTMQDEILEREMVEHYPFDEVFTSMSVVQTGCLNASLTYSQTEVEIVDKDIDVSLYYDLEFECFLEDKEYCHESS